MSEHEHDDRCLEEDVVDLGDDGDGYVAYPILVCNITGEELKCPTRYPRY